MTLLVVKSYLQLIRFGIYLVRQDFEGLCSRVRNYQVGETTAPHDSVERVCSAVDMACICYWREVLCLQRSAATACLLKRSGVPAELVIGTQQLPFKAHAWVEVDGCVVNDKSYTPEMYTILDRC
jgi:hypothetical protein